MKTGRRHAILRHRLCRSKSPVPVLLLVALVLSGLSGCAPDEAAPVADVDYSGWRQSTDTRLDFTVPGHGSGLRRIFVNETGLAAELDADGAIEYPDGTVFLKEVYADASPDAGADPAMLTIMVKAQGDPRSAGGWLWVVRDPQEGTETISGEGFCIRCHASANSTHPYGTRNPEGQFRDYIFHTPAVERVGAGVPPR